MSSHKYLQMLTVIFLSFVACLPIMITSAAHVHTHDTHGSHLTKERVIDGTAHIDSKGNHIDDYDHQAILGSKKTAKDFDNLSSGESRKRLRNLVTRGGMDANQDGFVDILELKDWILKSFKNLAKEDGEERLDEEDANGDGFVSWEEHLKDAFDINLDTDFEDLKDPENRQMMDEDKALWNAADLNKDKLLDKHEFPLFNSPEEYPEMRDVLYELTMIRRDKNKDGFIDLHEFLVDEQGLLPDANSESYVSEKDRFSNEYDQNKDGKLNRSEVLLWIIPDNDDLAEQEAEHLLLSCDDDGDEKLSVDEIVHHHDIFVGSEATDFGEKLKKDEL